MEVKSTLKVTCHFTFGFEGKIAVLANVRAHISVRSDVLFKHARLLAANATLSAYVLPSAAASHVDVLLVGLVSDEDVGETLRSLFCLH